jgi:tRNA(Ile)-lysidine synthase
MSNPSENSMVHAFRSAWPPAQWRDVTTLVGVSGGPDSVALLRLLTEVHPTELPRGRLRDVHPSGLPPGRLIVAHFDHGWRDGAAQDAAFVGDLAASLRLPCVRGSAADEPLRVVDERQTEERARALRYAFLVRTAKEHGARFLAVGHTADDQAETILHHVIRGSGLRGLAGIRPSRAIDESLALVRPLLGFRRAHLVDYLQLIGQPYRVDPSNADSSYTRAKIRHELLPTLRRYNTDVDESLIRLGSLASEAYAEITASAQTLLQESLVSSTESSAIVSVAALANASSFMVREMFVELWRQQDWPRKEMNYEKWESLAKLARGEVTRVDLPVHMVARCQAEARIEVRRARG